MSSIGSDGTKPEVPVTSPKKAPFIRNLWFLIGSAVFVIGIYVAVEFWEYSPMGNSLPNTIQHALIALTPILLAIWMAFLSGWGRRGIVIAGLMLFTLVGGAIAAVREVEFDGDMLMTFHYRWEPTVEDRIAKHREEQGGTALPVAANEESRAAFHEAFHIGTQDMADFRGHNREGIIDGPVLATDWTTKPPVEKWRIPVGEGYSSMAVVGDRLLTIEQRGDQEAIACYDANTGASLWEHLYQARFYEAMGGLGPRSTPVVDEKGRVYTLGGEGDAYCLDLFDGKVLWHHNLLKEYQLPNVTWAMSSSPLLLGNHVIYNAGSEIGQGLVAYDRETGRMIWEGAGLSRGSHAENLCGYSSPRLATLGGKEQILHFDGAGLGGYDIESGKTLWFYPFKNDAGVNVAQPLVLPDDQIFITASYNHGAAVVKVSADGEKFNATQAWTSPRSMRCKFTSPVLYNGIAYGLDEGILMALDPVKNDVKWKKGRYGHGQLLLSHDKLFILTEKGQMVLVEATPDSWQELASLQVLSDSVKVWNPPALVGNRAFVRDHHEMACYELPLANDTPAANTPPN
ncbi:PQQ-binding-like beta-propeller repeat protein [Lacunimicrobium album]